jgi:SRSO17 transposase
VAVNVSAASEAVSLPVAYQLCLPESWARDRARRRAACVPPEVPFQPKWQIALSQIRCLQSEGLPAAPVVADAGYGDTTKFRDAVTAAALPYVVGVKKGDHGVARGPGLPAADVTARPRLAPHAAAPHRTPSACPPQDPGRRPAPARWQTVTWREGTRGAMRSRFARLRVRPERHGPTSIATLYALLGRALLHTLPRRWYGHTPRRR